MRHKVLFVDDEPNILEAYKRQFRKIFQVRTAVGGQTGIGIVMEEGPFSVVVSDLKMPVMNGIEFLAKVKSLSPDTVRMMLTGYADLQTAIDAVNEGNIFRFLTKPCPPDKLALAIGEGLRQYDLIVAERELLEKTLKGSIQILSEILSLINPEAFGRSTRIRSTIREMMRYLEIANGWMVESAAMLSQIGCVILTEEVLKKVYHGAPLSDEESQLYNMYPSIGHDLVKNIPRMEEVAQIIAYQEKNFDGTGIPLDEVKGEKIPLGARLLKVALDFDKYQSSGLSPGQALGRMKKRAGWYDPRILGALASVISTRESASIRELTLNELKGTMILAEDIRSTDGALLVSKGQEITWPLIARLKNFSRTKHIQEPIKVTMSDPD